MYRDFFATMPRNITRSFGGRNLVWHALAIALTFISVTSGFDWMYFEATRPLARYLFPAVRLGWIVPVVLPIVLYFVGLIRKDHRAISTACAATQAVVIGLLVAAFYKAFTGRPGLRQAVHYMVNTSREFHFGFLKGGVFFGWPSSHTTVAFAMSAAVWKLYPDSKVMRCFALLYAFYVGIGVSMTIHWFSDFLAGAIIGTVIGLTVGKVFRERLLETQQK